MRSATGISSVKRNNVVTQYLTIFLDMIGMPGKDNHFHISIKLLSHAGVNFNIVWILHF